MIRVETLPPKARNKILHLHSVAMRHWPTGKPYCEVPEHPSIPLAPSGREVEASLMAEAKVHRFKECDVPRVGGGDFTAIVYDGPEWPNPVLVSL